LEGPIIFRAGFEYRDFPSNMAPRHLAGHSLLDAIMDMAEVWG